MKYSKIECRDCRRTSYCGTEEQADCCYDGSKNVYSCRMVDGWPEDQDRCKTCDFKGKYRCLTRKHPEP